MSEQLKPCPFCGDVPELPSGAGTQYEIECDGCGQAMASVQICDLMTVEERAADNFTNYRYAEEFVERAKHQAVENWNRRADDAALAAKDARIAELEQKIIGLEDAFASNLDYRAMYRQLRAQLASQQQAEPEDPCPVCGNEVRGQGGYLSCECPAPKPATPSEDWREVPVEYQQLSRYGNWDRIEKDVFDLGLIGTTPDRFRALYAAPVQHSRIVAAKDAEIARLRELHENAHSAAKTLMAERATLMEQAAHWLEVNAPSGGCIETNIADELRALLGKDLE